MVECQPVPAGYSHFRMVSAEIPLFRIAELGSGGNTI